jgi:hypothetical protein
VASIVFRDIHSDFDRASEDVLFVAERGDLEAQRLGEFQGSQRRSGQALGNGVFGPRLRPLLENSRTLESPRLKRVSPKQRKIARRLALESNQESRLCYLTRISSRVDGYCCRTLHKVATWFGILSNYRRRMLLSDSIGVVRNE